MPCTRNNCGSNSTADSGTGFSFQTELRPGSKRQRSRIARVRPVARLVFTVLGTRMSSPPRSGAHVHRDLAIGPYRPRMNGWTFRPSTTLPLRSLPRSPTRLTDRNEPIVRVAVSLADQRAVRSVAMPRSSLPNFDLPVADAQRLTGADDAVRVGQAMASRTCPTNRLVAAPCG